MRNKLILGLIVLLGFLGLLAFVLSTYTRSEINEKSELEDSSKNKNSSLKKQGGIEKLVFLYDEKFDINIEDNDFLDLNTKLNSIGVDKFTGEKVVDSYTPIKFFFLKTKNPSELSINEWFEENNPDQQKQSPYSVISQEEVLVGGIQSLRVSYAPSMMLTGGYYNLVVVYIPVGTDIYQIEGYGLPQEVDPLFTEADTQQAKEYEAIFDSVLKSIQFNPDSI